ncbi:transposase domain-containing protein [Escherichia coli]|nr:transposase domain-containing protein [Escherichia coli]
MSLLETAKRNGLEPHAWLTDVLARLPECTRGATGRVAAP